MVVFFVEKAIAMVILGKLHWAGGNDALLSVC